MLDKQKNSTPGEISQISQVAFKKKPLSPQYLRN